MSEDYRIAIGTGHWKRGKLKTNSGQAHVENKETWGRKRGEEQKKKKKIFFLKIKINKNSETEISKGEETGEIDQRFLKNKIWKIKTQEGMEGEFT